MTWLSFYTIELQEKLEMELKKHTEEAASKVAAVLQRAEEQGQMIESLHASVSIYSVFDFRTWECLEPWKLGGGWGFLLKIGPCRSCCDKKTRLI